MSNILGDNLNRENIRRLLASIGSMPSNKEESADSKATEYDWRQCRYFSTDELKRLDNFTKDASAQLSEKFTVLFHSDFNVINASITLHFAGELLALISAGGQDDYYLSFGPKQKNLFGLVGIPVQTAATWVNLLLGEPLEDSKLPPKAGTLSQLEESILFDIASAIVESLSTSLIGYYEFQPDKAIVKGKLPIELHGMEEICKIVFGIEHRTPNTELRTPNSGTQAYFLMPCGKLAPVVGKTVGADRQLSTEDISKAIFNHLQEMPVTVTARLATAMLTLEQVINLRSSDILLIDKEIDEPVELIVEGTHFAPIQGQSLFRGLPAKSAGHYALVITELSNNKDKIVHC